LLDNAYGDVGRTLLQAGELTDKVEQDLQDSVRQFLNVFAITREPETLSPERIVHGAEEKDIHLSETVTAGAK